MTVRRRWATKSNGKQDCQRGSEKKVKERERTRQQKRVIEFLSDRRLDLRVGREVDTARRFVKDNDGAFSQERSGHGDELSLSLREIGPTRGNLCLQRHCSLDVDVGCGSGDRHGVSGVRCCSVNGRRARSCGGGYCGVLAGCALGYALTA